MKVPNFDKSIDLSRKDIFQTVNNRNASVSFPWHCDLLVAVDIRGSPYLGHSISMNGLTERNN